jgi:hypothetical protein
MNTTRKILFAASLALCAAAAGFSQGTTPPPLTIVPPPHLDLSKLPPDLQALILQLQTQRAELRTLARALQDQLKGKTADERKAIIQQFRQDHATMIAAQRTLAREIRAELKALRQQRKGTG